MNRWARSVELPLSLVVEQGVLSRVPEIMDLAALDRQRPLVVSGCGPTLGFADHLARTLGPGTVLTRCREGTLVEAAGVATLAIRRGVTAIISVGGGKSVDVGKLAAARTGVPFVSVPTSVANDGISSPVASLLDDRGRRVSLGAQMPAAVVVDLDVIAAAPAALTAAGVGDLASNLIAAADWRLAGRRGHEAYDEFAGLIGEAAGQMVWELPTLEPIGRVRQLARGLLLSGLAMATAGTSRPCSGGEHLISHALDSVLGPAARPHGVQVALGTLLLAEAHGIQAGRLREVLEWCGLPTTIGAAGIGFDVMVTAVELAPKMRPGRYTILDELSVTGVTAAELVERSVA